MEPIVTAVLTNAEGWQKTYRLSEGIHLIGTAPDCLIRLSEGDSITPYHVQLVNDEREAHVRLVNLASGEMILETGSQELVFAPRTLRDLFGGETLYLGPYKLQFEIRKQYAPREITLEKNQQVVGLRLVLSSHLLHPGGMVSGTLYLRNLGSEPCQFTVELDGLPPECYQIEPPALINPGGEESSGIRIFHRWSAPAAGDALLTVRVSAPAVYPGRELTLQQTLKVFPSYRFQAAWGEDEPQPIPAVDPTAWPAPATAAAVSPVAVALPVEPTPEPPAAEEDLPVQADLPAIPAAEDILSPEAPPEPVGVAETLPEPVAEPLAAPLAPRGQKRPDLSGVKVVRVSTGDFLDDKGEHS